METTRFGDEEITHQVVKRVGQAMSVVRGTAAASNTDDARVSQNTKTGNGALGMNVL